MTNYSSRLHRRYEARRKRQIVIFSMASIIVLVLLIMYGFPAVLNFSGTISNLRRQPASVASGDNALAPTTPRLSEDLIATSSAKIAISGVTDPKTTVELFQNNRSLGTAVSQDDGIFTWDIVLERGDNFFQAQAIGETGRKSDSSGNYLVSYLSSPPKLEASATSDGTVSGSSDPGATISINDRLVVVESDGKFSYLLDLKDGENKIKIVATDPAGNQTAKELTVTKATP